MLERDEHVATSSATAIETLADEATQFLFFTGKGGVGKTSVACSVAVTLADVGKRVLIVSTDPASNLDEVLATPLTDAPRQVDGLHNLHASNLDPESAAAAYRETLIGPYRGVLPDATVASMEEQLSGACTVEIAAFNEFAKLVGDETTTEGYDVVIFDTAPTGHTLRLLTLPTAWTDFIETNTTGNSCLGPLAGLKAQRELYARTVSELADPAKTTLVLVSRPDLSALNEAARSTAELADLGIRNQKLVMNGLFSTIVPDDPIASALEQRGEGALRRMPKALVDLPRVEVPLIVKSPLAIDGLRALAEAKPGMPQPAGSFATDKPASPDTAALSTLVDDLTSSGSGVVMTMGKGGVGKTTLAAALAVELVRRGYPVHLSTTDPAAHVTDAVADFSGGLMLSRIDPMVEVDAYRKLVLEGAKDLDPESLALLEEDLRSPCTEEIAIFRAFARVVAEATDKFVILDTAPTGHTLLLIDSSEAYHREVMRNTTDTPPEVLELLPRLRDPDFTKVLVVTLAEATPVSEARRLQDDLRRAGIEPYAWIVNQSFATVETADPVLRSRGLNEIAHIESVLERDGKRVALVPWVPVPPVGEGLEALLTAGSAGGMSRYVYYCDDCETSYESLAAAGADSGTVTCPGCGSENRYGPARNEEETMAKYIYYCAECRNTFEVEVEHPEEGVPLTSTCPTCGNKNAMKAFSAEDLKPAGGCAPGSGC